MTNADELVGNAAHDNSVYCLAQPGELYLVYLPAGGAARLDLSAAAGDFTVAWFNPREGGALQPSGTVRGGARVTLSAPNADDWLAIVRRSSCAASAEALPAAIPGSDSRAARTTFPLASRPFHP